MSVSKGVSDVATARVTVVLTGWGRSPLVSFAVAS